VEPNDDISAIVGQGGVQPHLIIRVDDRVAGAKRVFERAPNK
jgi:hypothetical protein